MLKKTRVQIMEDFRAQVKSGKILVGVGAGTGITAKCSEKADVDMLIIYNSGRFRMAGRGSLSGLLAYGDANKIVTEMGQEVLPIVKKLQYLRAFAVLILSASWKFSLNNLKSKALMAFKISQPLDLLTVNSVQTLKKLEWVMAWKLI